MATGRGVLGLNARGAPLGGWAPSLGLAPGRPLAAAGGLGGPRRLRACVPRRGGEVSTRLARADVSRRRVDRLAIRWRRRGMTARPSAREHGAVADYRTALAVR